MTKERPRRDQGQTKERPRGDQGEVKDKLLLNPLYIILFF
jgi:hypothetical protein